MNHPYSPAPDAPAPPLLRDAEEALRRSEGRLHLALEAAGMALWELDLADGSVSRSPRHDEIYGYATPLPRWSYEDFVAHVLPEDRAALQTRFQAALASADDLDLEFRIRRADGDVRWLWSRARMLRDGGGQVRRVLGVIVDITARKRTEAALDDAESRFKLLADAMPQLSWVAHPDGHLEYYNRRWYDYFGWIETGEVDQNWMGTLHPDDRQRALNRWNRSVQTGVDYEVEYRMRGSNGAYRWFLARAKAVRATDGTILCWLGTCTDVEDIKQHEFSAALRSEQLRQLNEVTIHLSQLNDVGAIVMLLNEEARNLIGCRQALTCMSLDPDWRRAHVSASLSDQYAHWQQQTLRADPELCALIMAAHGPLRLSRAQLDSSGFFHRYRLNAGLPLQGLLAVPLSGLRNGQQAFVQLSHRIEGEFTADDEAVLVQLAQMASSAIRNAQLLEDLRQADRRKDQFLATLAHELRNPLAPLRNGLQLMKLAKDDLEAGDKARAMMDRQVEQMVRLIDDLMDVSRISLGRVDLRREPVELAAIVQQAVETSRPLIQQSGHTLGIDLPSQPVLVDADATRLTQVFANLLNNAAKYTERGGSIRLGVEVEDGAALISVRDSGIGIPPAMLPRVFDLFTQVDCSLEKTRGGLGIGLSLVKGLVEMHGGTVEAWSDGEGLGSIFTVRLPVVTPEALQRRAGNTAETRQARRPGRRILVADDNRDAADSLAMLLTVMGHTTRTAHDGLEALEACSEFRPDAILLDIGMPRLNGYDTCRRIRAADWGKHAVLIACTGWGQEDDKRQAREAGFDFHLVKPVNPAALDDLLANVLPSGEA